MLIAVPRQLFRVLPLASALTLASVPNSLTFASETESGSVSANDATARVLKLNISSDGYPPYLIIDRDGNPGGIAYDVISRIADRLGYTVEPLRVPRKRVDDLLLEGHIDATPRAREWTENPDQYLFTDPIIDVQEVFFTPAEKRLDFDSPETLPRMKVVTPLGYYYPKLQGLFESGHLERFEVSNDRDMFTYLLHGDSFDAAIADLTVGRWIIRENDWRGKFRHTDNTIGRYGYRVMLRKDWQEFAESFNEELAGLRANGELDVILDQYR